MSDPIAVYGAQILAKDGIRISGDTRSGMGAMVKYLLSWDNAFQFVTAVISPVNASRVGAITFNLPYRFPTTATPIYAQSFDIQPCGVRGDLTVITDLPNKGLTPGEYFSHAIVTIGFQQLPWTFDLTQDPDGLNQLDPENPITYCEQAVKIGGNFVTQKGHLFRYASTGKPVVGDVGVVVTEAKLVLRFPKVPYLPWQLLLPYTNKINSQPVLSCAAKTLLLEAPDTTAKASLNSTVPIEQNLVLEFAYNPIGWNKVPLPDGTYDDVVRGDSTGIYQVADFRDIFSRISFTEGA